MSGFFNILLLPLTLFTRVVCAYPIIAISIATVLTVVTLVLHDRVIAASLAMFGGIVMIWYDEFRRPALPEQGGAPAA